MIIGAILNILLDPIFIFKMNLGIKGDAIATMLFQYITTFILLKQYVTKKTLLTIHFKIVLVKKHILNEIMKIGLPTFARQLLTGLFFTLYLVFHRAFSLSQAIVMAHKTIID